MKTRSPRRPRFVPARGEQSVPSAPKHQETLCRLVNGPASQSETPSTSDSPQKSGANFASARPTQPELVRNSRLQTVWAQQNESLTASALAQPVNARAFHSTETGFVLLKAPWNVLYANEKAIEILAYPSKPAAFASLDKLVAEKIRPLLRGRELCEPGFSVELRSGRRRFVCRSFRLDAGGDPAERRPVALIIERAQRPCLDVSQAAARFRLTPRERQALSLLVQGLTNKEIAGRMGISPNTVKTFLRMTMGKMGVSSRVGLLRKTVQILSE